MSKNREELELEQLELNIESARLNIEDQKEIIKKRKEELFFAKMESARRNVEILSKVLFAFIDKGYNNEKLKKIENVILANLEVMNDINHK